MDDKKVKKERRKSRKNPETTKSAKQTKTSKKKDKKDKTTEKKVQKKESTIPPTLLQAIQDDDIDGFQEDINDSEKIKSLIDGDGNNILHLCAKYNAKEIVALLKENKQLFLNLLNEKNSNLETPFFVATARNNFEIVKIFCKIGKSSIVSVADSQNVLPIHNAFFFNDSEMVKLLVSLNADVNSVDSLGRSPLHFAVLKICEQRICKNYGGDISLRFSTPRQ